MRVSLAEYHLIYLFKNQLIIANRESGYLRFYVKGKVGTEDKKVLALLRQDVPLRIMLFLIKNANSQHKTILENIDIAASTLSYHLKKLVKCGLIDVHAYGEERGYSIVNREMVVRLLIQYKPYKLIEGFRDIWIDLSVD
jgi:predicted transcriptional regulator